MLNNMLSGPHLLVVVLFLVLLFGAPRLPALAKSLGQSMRILKTEVGGGADDPVGEAPPNAPNDGASKES